MRIIKTLIYFISGMLLIVAATCAGLFYFEQSVQAMGGTLMFLCFGSAGVMLGYHLDSIIASVKGEQSDSGHSAV